MCCRGSISSFSSAGFITIWIKYLKPQVGDLTKGLLKGTASKQEPLHIKTQKILLITQIRPLKLFWSRVNRVFLSEGAETKDSVWCRRGSGHIKEAEMCFSHLISLPEVLIETEYLNISSDIHIEKYSGIIYHFQTSKKMKNKQANPDYKQITSFLWSLFSPNL